MITVIHKRDATGAPNEFYIGRPSPLGNPFVIGKDGDRKEVVLKYEKWFKTKIITEHDDNEQMAAFMMLQEAASLGDIKLVCWCAPKACHGDVIKKYLEVMS